MSGKVKTVTCSQGAGESQGKDDTKQRWVYCIGLCDKPCELGFGCEEIF